MINHGYYQVACASFPIDIGNVDANVQHIITMANASCPQLQLMVFGELTLTGYSCQDLFYESILVEAAKEGLKTIAREVRENLVVVVGLPLAVNHRLYNVAAYIFNHQVIGFQAKSYLPNYNEFYEKRWFHSGLELNVSEVLFDGRMVPIGTDLLVHDTTTQAIIGCEICEDLWVPTPVSNHHFEHGANIIVNLSAGDELVSKANYRRQLVSLQSQKLACGYIYCSGGEHESTSDMLFTNHQIIASNGKIIQEANEEGLREAVLDLEIYAHERRHFNSLLDGVTSLGREIRITSKPVAAPKLQNVNAYPFVPSHPEQRCLEIIDIQAKALSRRLNHLTNHRVVVGISGGLDSTLALLVCMRAFDLNHWDPSDIIAVTMPGFGTTDHTYHNATRLVTLLGASLHEISIVPATTQHLKDINHPLDAYDITYENAQARERTQILMDLANKHQAIVIGTGDLSEMALGWCTYNGDHMSMYAVNSSIPKTLVASLVATYAKVYAHQALQDVLLSIVDTPISPELLPPDKLGQIAQKTENTIGAYRYHDFFLYYFLRYHFSPTKIFELACVAFKEDDPKVILKTLRGFYWRFFTQQFKRNCVPDGIKVGSVSLSPRADWRMPSDASMRLWLKEIEKLETMMED